MLMGLTILSSNNDIVTETVKYKWGRGAGQPEHGVIQCEQRLGVPYIGPDDGRL